MKIVLIFFVFVIACQTNSKQVSIQQSQLGTKYAKQGSYFAACGTICMEEQSAGQIRHDVVRDEATLASVGPNETCIDLVVRTHSLKDEPFDQLNAVCKIDGAETATAIETELVTLTDYNYTGKVETLHVEAVTPDAFGALSVSEPQELIFRVVERQGRICCGAPANGAVEFSMRNRAFDYGASPGKVKYQWTVSGSARPSITGD